MDTNIKFSIRIPEGFDLQVFESDFIKKFQRLGVNIKSLEKMKTSFIDEQSGDTISFQFRTDYVFCNPETYERVIQERKYEKLEFFKDQFNSESEIKVETINLLNELKVKDEL